MTLEKDRLSSAQMVILGLFAFIGDMALVYPAVMASSAHQDAWITGLISVPLGIGTIFLLVTLGNIDPTKTIIELSRQILGKWLGGAVGLYYLFFYLLAGSTYIREIEDFLCTQIYEGTPGGVIRAMGIFILVYGLRLGLETLGRASQIFFPLFALFLVCLIVLLLPQVRVDRLLPMLNTPVPDMIHSVMYGVFYPFGEMCVFLMIYPYVRKSDKINRDIFLSICLGAVVLNIILILSLTVLGVYFSEHDFYAAYLLARKINIANFLQRIEALMATAWIISTYFKTVLFFYAFVLGTAQFFKLKSYRPLIFPTAFLLYGLSQLIAKNIIFYVSEIPAYWVDWNFTYAFVLPVIMLSVNTVRKRLSRGS
ncbi:spore gernimation protein [Paenibacillus sp. FSL R7-0273]|uniref:GerAB/ArcD/ProY family transporter n=1 Tax=Paenibacillus sp. FSL R7-0273 TaxID=1536772 RepID=UPI0004F8CC43|nr:endospore germination permease [Paenibacillus sp. FSL R7-0273]AIQ46632.1 spore gernimation protein [Paenibacillus sp. FSL R7-0273]OMF97596.1 spore gernimation protein [Paenibacillus sp. FSL R7-0273]